MTCSRRRPIVLAMLLLSAVLTPAPARAAIQGADDPKAYTEHDYRRARLDFNRRTLGGAYDRVGKHDPAWDEKAKAFLDGMAVYFAYANSEPCYWDVPRPTGEQLLALGKAAVDAGCDDPLVLYCRAAMLDDLRRPEHTGPMLERAAQGLIDRKYPAYRVAAAVSRLEKKITGLPRSEAAVANYRKVTWDARIISLVEKNPDRDKDIRILLEMADEVFAPATPARKLEFCRTVEGEAGADPWVVNILYGRYERAAAWEARGGGFANTVTPEGWRGFAEHLAKAHDYLAKAHALHPDRPEAATELIKVTMGGGAQFNEAPRDWFDKATRAQLDYEPAYNAYVYSILPRWGGDYRTMFDFGRECVASGRYDTDVPYQLMRIVRRINGDETDGDTSGMHVLAIPEVYAAIEELFTKLVERAKDEPAKVRYASEHIALAWRAGRYDAAAAVMDQFGDRVQPEPFTELLGWAPGAMSQVRLMTSRFAKAAAAAETDLEANNPAAAVTAYEAITAKLPADHPGQLFARYRLRAARIQKALAESDDWVSLAPDADFAPWTVTDGDWRREKDGTIVATGNAQGHALLLCRAELGTAYELRATVESWEGAKSTIPAIYPNWWYSKGWAVAAVSIPDQIVVAQGYRKNPQAHLPITGPVVLGVRVDGPRFTVTIDGKPALPDVPINPATPTHDMFAGLGIHSRLPGGIARFRDVQVRRIRPAADEK